MTEHYKYSFLKLFLLFLIFFTAQLDTLAIFQAHATFLCGKVWWPSLYKCITREVFAPLKCGSQNTLPALYKTVLIHALSLLPFSSGLYGPLCLISNLALSAMAGTRWSLCCIFIFIFFYLSQCEVIQERQIVSGSTRFYISHHLQEILKDGMLLTKKTVEYLANFYT